MFYKYILELFAYFGFSRNPLLNIEDKYVELKKEDIDMV